MINLKDFINKNKKTIIILLIVMLLISFTVIYFAVIAATDPYSNRITTISSGVNIYDGTQPFNTTAGVGNDTSIDNKIVRNFDTVMYTVNYSLKISNLDGLTDLEKAATPTRTVFFEILVPESLNAVISYSSPSGTNTSQGSFYSLTSDVGNVTKYNYLKVSTTALANVDGNKNNNFTFFISNINSTNNSILKPIVLMYESTKSDVVTISNNIRMSDFVRNKSNLTIDEVRVTGVEDYIVKLYKGTPLKASDNNKEFPVAIVAGLDNSSEFGIKGKIIPKEINLSLDFSNSSSSNFSLVSNTGPYDASDFIITKLNTEPFPKINDLTNNNANNGSLEIDFENKKATVKIKNIGYLENSNSYFTDTDGTTITNMKIVTAQTFKFKENRESSNVSDFNINISAKKGTNEVASLVIDEKYDDYVGDLISKISVLDTDLQDVSTENVNLLNYTYDETFYLNSSFAYGSAGGSVVSDMTNYIKIDNSALKVVSYDAESDNNLPYSYTATQDSETINPTYEVKYGYGSWNASSFNVNSGCSINLNTLSKEQIMNLYGGSCITEKPNQIVWKDSNEIAENADRSPILIKIITHDVDYKTKIDFKFRLKVTKGEDTENNDYLLATAPNPVYQISTSSTATFNGTKYYLSSQKNTNNQNLNNINNYVKASSNFLTEGHSLDPSISGASIIVSGVRTNAPSITSYYNKSESNAFDNYPIEWEFKSRAIKGDNTAKITGATVKVYLPKYLDYIYMQNSEFIPTKTFVTYNNEEYTLLTFSFAGDKIKDGLLTFGFNTNNTFDAPETVSQTVFAVSDFTVVKNPNVSDPNSQEIIFNVKTPESLRTSDRTITIHNYGEVASTAVANPNLIEPNTPYTYTIKAKNNSRTSSKMSLIYVLPYEGDIFDDEQGSNFDGALSVKLSRIEGGYKIYYTDTSSKSTIIGTELKDSEGNNWKEWNDYTIDKSGVTAIKVEAINPIGSGEFFINNTGITITVTPVNNKVGNEYYNTYTIITDKSGTKDILNGSNSIVSVYNRKINGMVFEDADYNGLYLESEEKLMEDISVELYKLAETNIGENPNILTLMSENDEKIADTTTNEKGEYFFRGLDSGNYYVKYTFDCEKYTATDKLKEDPNEVDSSKINSNANMLKSTCAAVSDIVTVDNEHVEVKNINLGLAIRKNFGVNLKKYITNVTIFSNKGTQSYDYNNETKVKVDVKNLRNAKLRVTYKFELENSKYFPGYVGAIYDVLPEGMTFDSTLNTNAGWVNYGGLIYYTRFQNILIMPGEKYYFEIAFDLDSNSGGDFVNIVNASEFSILGEGQVIVTPEDEVVEEQPTTEESE